MPRKESKPQVSEESGDLLASIFSGDGYSNVSESSFSMPYLTIVNDRSQVVQKNSKSYNADVKVGQFYCSALKFSADTVRVRVLNINHVVKSWTEASGPGNFGTPVATHPYQSFPMLKKSSDKFKALDADGNELRETLEYTLLDVDRGEMMVFPMAGTAIRPAKDWNTRIQALRVNRDTLKVDPHGQSGLATWLGVWELTPQQTVGGWYNIGSSPHLVGTIDPEDVSEIRQLEAYSARAKSFVATMMSGNALGNPQIEDSGNGPEKGITH